MYVTLIHPVSLQATASKEYYIQIAVVASELENMEVWYASRVVSTPFGRLTTHLVKVTNSRNDKHVGLPSACNGSDLILIMSPTMSGSLQDSHTSNSLLEDQRCP